MWWLIMTILGVVVIVAMVAGPYRRARQAHRALIRQNDKSDIAHELAAARWEGVFVYVAPKKGEDDEPC